MSDIRDRGIKRAEDVIKAYEKGADGRHYKLAFWTPSVGMAAPGITPQVALVSCSQEDGDVSVDIAPDSDAFWESVLRYMDSPSEYQSLAPSDIEQLGNAFFGGVNFRVSLWG